MPTTLSSISPYASLKLPIAVRCSLPERAYMLDTAAVMAKENFHFGAWLKREVATRGIPSLKFSQIVGVTESTLHRWYRDRAPKFREHTLGRLATALGFPLQHLQILLLEAMKADPENQQRWAEQERRMREASGDIGAWISEWEKLKKEGIAKDEETEELDANVEPYNEVPVPEIPTFNLPIAAGPWMELPDVPEVHNLTTQRDGRFRVQIRGDSMEGKDGYPDGSLVEFRLLKPDFGDGRGGSRMEIGRDYYVQKSECATFKKLEEFTDEVLYFRAINRRKYPDRIKVLRADVVRMAKAEYVLQRKG